MTLRGPFPTTRTELNDYFDIAVPYLNDNNTRLSVSTENLGALNGFYDNGPPGAPQNVLGWSQLWPIYSNEGEVNDNIRDIMDNREDEMQTILRTIYADIPESALTENDRNTLNLQERDTTPTTIQAVDFAPVLSIDKVSNGIQQLRLKSPDTPDSNAMPENQKAEVQRFVGEAGLVDNDIEFEPFQDTGRHLLTVEYEPVDKGKTAYYRARYKTETGKTGPWSDVVNELVL